MTPTEKLFIDYGQFVAAKEITSVYNYLKSL